MVRQVSYFRQQRKAEQMFKLKKLKPAKIYFLFKKQEFNYETSLKLISSWSMTSQQSMWNCSTAAWTHKLIYGWCRSKHCSWFCPKGETKSWFSFLFLVNLDQALSLEQLKNISRLRSVVFPLTPDLARPPRITALSWFKCCSRALHRAHTQFDSWHWFPVTFRIQFRFLVITLKVQSGQESASISEQLQKSQVLWSRWKETHQTRDLCPFGFKICGHL